MEKVKIGIIGLGGIAQVVHLPILSKIPKVEIAGAAEVNKNRLNTVSEKFGLTNTFSDYKEMIKNIELNAVIIASPTNTHREIAVDVLNSGLDVLIEKPIALNFTEAVQIEKAAQKNNRKAMVAMNMRFRPDAMLLKSLIGSGAIGKVFYISCSWLRRKSSQQKWFVQESKAGGGVLIDLGISLLDLGTWLLDFPGFDSVSVQTYNHTTRGVEDSAVGLLRFSNSSVIHFETSWSLHSDKESFNLTAYGTEGSAHLNPLRAYHRADTGSIDYTPARTANLKNLFKKSYENELRHFVSSIKTGSKILSSADEAVSRMKLLENVYKSAEKKSEVKFK